LFEQHLVALRNYKPVHAPVYDFVLHTRTASESIPAAKIILVDGHLILSIEKIRTLIDYSVYLDTGPDIMFIRRMMRDIKERGRTVNSVVDQYLISVREMYFEFTFPSMQYADSVVSGEKDLESIISLVAEDIERKFGIINVRF
jgi:uridine kinase